MKNYFKLGLRLAGSANSHLQSVILCSLMMTCACCACQKKQEKVSEATSQLPQKELEVVAKGHHTDSLCFVVEEKGVREWLRDGQTYHALTADEKSEVNRLLMDFWASGGGDSSRVYTRNGKDSIEIRKPLPYNEYYKQLISYKENNQIMVCVYLNALIHIAPGEDIRERMEKRITYVNDGGIYFGEAIVNLSTRKIIRFSLNGEG